MREKTVTAFSQVPIYTDKLPNYEYKTYGRVFFKNAPNICLSIIYGKGTYSNWRDREQYRGRLYEVALIRENSDDTLDFFPLENWIDPKKHQGDYSGDVSGWMSTYAITNVIKNISKIHGQAYCKLKQ